MPLAHAIVDTQQALQQSDNTGGRADGRVAQRRQAAKQCMQCR